MPVSRAQVLAYRAAVHDLTKPADHAASCSVLHTGVQDYPVGASAHLALRARTSSPAASDIQAGLDDAALVLIHSVRGAAHLHRAEDLDMLAAALRLDDASDVAPGVGGPFWGELAAAGRSPDDALDEVAAAMLAVMSDQAVRTKGELSEQIQPAVDIRLRPWCEGCRANHVHDQLFRLATLQAGLMLQRGDPSEPLRFQAPTRKVQVADRSASRSELLRRFLRLTGPATPDQLAGWMGISTAAARRRWNEVADDLVPVDVDGLRAWTHARDLDQLRSAAAPPDRLLLLPPYDPVTELAIRGLLVPHPAARRQVWQAAANPGLVFVAGEIVGGWRRRIRGHRITLTVTPFTPLTVKQHTALEEEAARLGSFLGMPEVDVAVA